MNKKIKLIKDQNGIASTVIVILVMTLITLIVIGMSQNANREQRESLDRELGTQAQYAAEAGIADAIDYIETNKDAGTPIPDEITKCGDFPTPNENLTDSGNVKYTCVLYDKGPNTLEYSSISDRSELIPINTTKNSPITISWQEKEGDGIKLVGCSSPTKTFEDIDGYNCSVGVMRLDIIDPRGSFSRQQLIDKTYTSFMVPTTGAGGSISFGSPSTGDQNRKGVITPAKCVNNPTAPSKKCSVTINGLGTTTGDGNTVYLRLKSIYKESEVSVYGGATFDPAVAFNDAQVIIDSTGRASDVLKRVQVRSPIPNKQYFPEFAIYSVEDLCKLLQIGLNDTGGGLITNELACR